MWKIFVFVINSIYLVSSSCPSTCQCPPKEPLCAAGVSVVLDSCKCCKVCGRQLFEDCSVLQPCDPAKELECNFGGRHKSAEGICRAKSDGRPCEYNGKIYQNGESFHPDCKHLCICKNGFVGCVSEYPHEVSVTKPGCPKSLRVKVPGSRSHSKDHTSTRRRKCLSQTTDWSPCSRSCGNGVSTRVTNGNIFCTPVTETKICEVQPCKQITSEKAQKCDHMGETIHPLHLSYAGCSSMKKFQPNQCGPCLKGRHPHRSHKLTVRFRCKNGETIRRKVMVAKSCQCNYNCNEKLSDLHNLSNDVLKVKL